MGHMSHQFIHDGFTRVDIFSSKDVIKGATKAVDVCAVINTAGILGLLGGHEF